MRAASIFYHGMFRTEDYKLPKIISYKKDLIPETAFHQELASFMDSEDMLSSEITVRGQTYENGDLIVVKMEDSDTAKIGIVQSILIKRGKVYFVCKVYHCIRHWLQYFESVSSEEFSTFVESKTIADFKPLIKRGTSQKFVFFMHHRVSFAYE